MPLKMAEAEVSLRLAMFLVAQGHVDSDVSVALDGAHVQIKERQVFDVIAFLRSHGWSQSEPTAVWQGTYGRPGARHSIAIHSRPGCGDVTATLRSGAPLVVESKGGPLLRSSSSSEYPALREAMGQLMTLAIVPEGAVLAVAVPHAARFVELASRWREAPLVQRAGIRILTVSDGGEVCGW